MRQRRLILMRHATAAGGTGRDVDRPLTPSGRDEARFVGECLRLEGPIPDRVLCSTALRCRETWRALAAGLEAGAPSAIEVAFEAELYNATAAGLLHAVRCQTDPANVLVLAHNPGISVFALELVRRDPESAALLRGGFSPATIAVFEVDGPWPELSPESVRLLRFDRPPRADSR
jgi:phosphohistidine phosphatase